MNLKRGSTLITFTNKKNDMFRHVVFFSLLRLAASDIGYTSSIGYGS